MKVIESTKIVYFDVDETLITFTVHKMHDGDWYRSKEFMPTPNGIEEMSTAYHVEHIALLKQFKARGHTVVVWSAGGAKWAETAIKHLNLQKYVDLVIDKPDFVIDDKASSEWMPKSDFIGNP